MPRQGNLLQPLLTEKATSAVTRADAKSRISKPRPPDSRSEDAMNSPIIKFSRSLALLLALIAPAVIANAQSASATGRVRAASDNGITRPRVIAVNRDGGSVSVPQGRESAASRTAKELERRVFDLINQKRAERGLKQLTWNSRVAEVARGHSNEMALYDYFSHTGLDGKMVDQRAFDKGLDRWSAIGENIAYLRGFDDPAEYAVERWMLSPSHKKNLLDPRWRETGIGLAVASDGTFFFTQVFMVEGKQ